MAVDQALAEELVSTVRAWVDRDVVPNVARFELSDEFPQAMFDQMCEFGLFGATIQEEYGGLGLDVTTYARIIEELARIMRQTFRPAYRPLKLQSSRHRPGHYRPVSKPYDHITDLGNNQSSPP